MAVDLIGISGDQILQQYLAVDRTQTFLMKAVAPEHFPVFNAFHPHTDIAVVPGGIPADQGEVGTELFDLQIFNF